MTTKTEKTPLERYNEARRELLDWGNATGRSGVADYIVGAADGLIAEHQTLKAENERLRKEVERLKRKLRREQDYAGFLEDRHETDGAQS